MSKVASLALVTQAPQAVNNDEAALAADTLNNLIFASTNVLQDYSVNSPEHQAVCTLIGLMEEPMSTLKEYCAQVSFTPSQDNETLSK